MPMNAMTGKAFTAVALVLTWAFTLVTNVLFFTRVVRWPLDLTLLMLLPFTVILFPGSFSLAMAGNERHQRGEGLDLTSRFFMLAGLLGLLTAALTALVVWLYVTIGAGWRLLSVVLVTAGLACIWGVARVFREIINEVRHGGDRGAI